MIPHEVKVVEAFRFAKGRHDILIAGHYGSVNKEIAMRVEKMKTSFVGALFHAVNKYNSIEG